MYSGTLKYDGEENYIDVQRFIERKATAAVQLTTTWADLGIWSVDTPMFETPTGWESPALRPKNLAGKEDSTDARIAFHVIDRSPAGLTIEGTWAQEGEIYTFRGELTIAS